MEQAKSILDFKILMQDTGCYDMILAIYESVYCVLGGKMKKIYSYEPYFFMFFGIFHLHRILA